jgi:hypothetical protein
MSKKMKKSAYYHTTEKKLSLPKIHTKFNMLGRLGSSLRVWRAIDKLLPALTSCLRVLNCYRERKAKST